MENTVRPLPTTKWNFPEIQDPQSVSLLSDELKIHPILSSILVNRSIITPDDAKKFLWPTLSELHNPFLMKDMQKGVERVIQAIHNKQRIAVYGDYDVDGITSLVILYKFLNMTRSNVSYYIPDRVEEGYSLNNKAIDRIKADGAALIITVDCGTSDQDEISYANSLGLDTIVLDHHEISGPLPAAVAVINTNRSDCRFPFKSLAGVGIVFNFIIALRGRLREEGFWAGLAYPNLRDFLDLVALGTIGDISSLTDENRIFVKIGMDLINKGARVGLKALVKTSAMERVDSIQASYSIIPRLNAAGRVASPRESVNLLLTEDSREAETIARRLKV